jgi:hypothetical protein
MAFKIEITPRNDPTGATAYAVIVSIDDHETVLSFESKEAAESFAETERARLGRAKSEKRPTDVNAASVRRDRGGRNRRIR